ncbi:hypothetical protein T440DRAFT_520608 [Plenodomus tracheiphilus IPT5]|uniref:Uncharacterized protein n=1 Tax=Plenodomus tracheiphilus IPT5 TaxID=1408161 RepID=A0A6A7AY08_9PLEO|nr:hypothetical protein T440DRAFT_520608 [Plenodomus tracheiphilus IPT5]
MAKIKPEPQLADPQKSPTSDHKQRLQASLAAQSKVHDLLQETTLDLFSTRAELESTQAEFSQAQREHAATERLLHSEQHDHDSLGGGYFHERHQNDVQEVWQRIAGLEEALAREQKKAVANKDVQEILKQSRRKWSDMSSICDTYPEVKEKVVGKDDSGAEPEGNLYGQACQNKVDAEPRQRSPNEFEQS